MDELFFDLVAGLFLLSMHQVGVLGSLAETDTFTGVTPKVRGKVARSGNA